MMLSGEIQKELNEIALQVNKSQEEVLKKSLRIYKEFLKLQIKGIFPYLRLILTNKCNFSCFFCKRDFYFANNIEEVDFDFLKEVVNSFVELGGNKILLSGGEPFLYSKIKFLLKYLKTFPDLTIKITTNGSLLHQYKDYLQYVDGVNISIHSYNIEDYMQITKTNQKIFEKVFENLELLKNLRIETTINIVYLPKYRNGILKLIEFAKNEKLKIEIMNLINASEEEYKEFLYTVANLINNGNKHIMFKFQRNPMGIYCAKCPNKYNCVACQAIWCFPDKIITPCPYNKIYLPDTKDIKEIIENSVKFYNMEK